MLKGKVAFITGASRGIGKAIALKFAENNANLVLIATKVENLKNVEDEIKKFNIDYLLLGGNIADEEDVNRFVKETIKKFGKIDILVNNAGITKDNLVMRMKSSDWDEVMNVNLKGAFLLIKTFSRYFIKQRSGKIINISSIVGLMGNPGQANYSASKAGIIGLTKSIAKELGPRNIQVNAIAPGFIQTEMTKNLESKVTDELKKAIALERLGTPEDVANVALFLASNMSDYITGTVINVSGGLYM